MILNETRTGSYLQYIWLSFNYYMTSIIWGLGTASTQNQAAKQKKAATFTQHTQIMSFPQTLKLWKKRASDICDCDTPIRSTSSSSPRYPGGKTNWNRFEGQKQIGQIEVLLSKGET